MFNRISHIGIVVASIEQALLTWRDELGFRKCAEAHFEEEGIRSVFLSLSGNLGEMCIELMEPVDQSDMTNPVARRLARNGEGFYHLALVTDDVAASGQALREAGLAILERPPVGNAEQGRWLIHPKAASGVMVEGIEEWKEGGL
jgi:methylmalonyl-CoA/ethylmalonyl-CoA epimerase